MAERQNFGTGTCPVCDKADIRLTAEGKIRSHGKRGDPCEGSGKVPQEDAARTDAPQAPGQGPDVVFRVANGQGPDGFLRPTASEFRSAQVALQAPGETPEYMRLEPEETVRRGTSYGVRPDDDAVTTVAPNGTPMTVHGGPNPHRAPLPTTQPQGFGMPDAITDGFVQAGFLPHDRSEAQSVADARHAPPFAAAPAFQDPSVNEVAQDANPSLAVGGPLFVPAPDAPTVKGGSAVRPGPTDKDFDRWNRYMIPDPVTGELKGRQRVTTFAKSISDQYGLSQWQQRKLLIGAAQNPAVAASASRLDVKRDREALDGLVDTLKTLAGANEAAEHGTRVHTYTEHVDMGVMTDASWSDIPDVVKWDLQAYVQAMADAGLTALPNMVERSTIVRSLDVAGTLDRILQLPNGDHIIGDVKTGQDLKYGQLDIEIQLACYAHGVNENGVWDWGTRTWNPAPKVRTDFAIVMHVPAGGGRCELLEMDLARGWANATLARSVVLARKGRNKVTPLNLDRAEFGGNQAPVPILAPAPAQMPSAVWTTDSPVTEQMAVAMQLQVGPPTLPHLAEPSDPLEPLRGYAREAMLREYTPQGMARVYETAMANFPPGDPVFGELAGIGNRSLNIPF